MYIYIHTYSQLQLLVYLVPWTQRMKSWRSIPVRRGNTAREWMTLTLLRNWLNGLIWSHDRGHGREGPGTPSLRRSEKPIRFGVVLRKSAGKRTSKRTWLQVRGTSPPRPPRSQVSGGHNRVRQTGGRYTEGKCSPPWSGKCCCWQCCWLLGGQQWLVM